MDNNGKKKQNVLLTPSEKEKLDVLRWKLKQSDSISYTKSLYERIMKIIFRGKRRYAEYQLEESEHGIIHEHELYSIDVDDES
ncbi:hypothetical protein ABID56_001015 [Alkalibacillus flavidus]|uniref:Uncharacterized protein n=1 Tax=Alkalibacillus flavidus TaxID=546021 RepID=A0ABV2KTL3_9BACI